MAALLASLTAVTTGSARAGNTGMITGVVRDASTNGAVAGADVYWANEFGFGQTQADSSGHFSFLLVAPGNTTISVIARGFVPGCLTGTVGADERLFLPFNIVPAKRTMATPVCHQIYFGISGGADVYDIY